MESILDADLHTCSVMECSLAQLQAITDEFRHFWAAVSAHQLEILKAYGDLLIEITGEAERREWLNKRLLLLQRQVAREGLPTYFWRVEPDTPLPAMLKWRAAYLIHRRRACLDDTWDLLREFASDYANDQISDKDLGAIIQAAQNAKGM